MRASDLPVCAKCGWHALLNHYSECWPKAGAAADRLAAALAPIPSTKLGYGGHKLTFKFDEEHSITFRLDEDGSFAVDHVYWLGYADAEQASRLTRALSAVAEQA